jgi:hypothetical protein
MGCAATPVAIENNWQPPTEGMTLRVANHKGTGAQTKLVHTLLLLIYLYSQPEQEAQQSAESQHPACAAVAVPATPSAMTTINNITFNVFIIFSF